MTDWPAWQPWDDARAKIEAANADWGLPIEWPNEPFDRPEPPAPFLSVEIAGDELMPVELGGRLWQEIGHLYVHVLTPKGKPINDDQVGAYRIAKAVANVFRGLPAPTPGSTQSVVYLSASIGVGVPGDDDGNFYRLVVSIQYRCQDITP